MEANESSEDKIQRALNAAKQRVLEEKFGAMFSGGESKAPPHIIGDWLNYVEQFELQYKNAKRVTLREFVGNPAFKPLTELLPDQIEAELDAVLDHLGEHAVNISFLADVPVRERYQFIIEELLDKETDDICIDGMSHNFIYEEFHPNDEYDAKMFAETFLRFLLAGDTNYAAGSFSKGEIRDASGKLVTRAEMQEDMLAFKGQFASFIEEKKIEPTDCVVEGDYATVSFNLTWEARLASDLHRASYTGVAKLQMKRSPYDGWDVVQAIVPGWNC